VDQTWQCFLVVRNFAAQIVRLFALPVLFPATPKRCLVSRLQWPALPRSMHIHDRLLFQCQLIVRFDGRDLIFAIEVRHSAGYSAFELAKMGISLLATGDLNT